MVKSPRLKRTAHVCIVDFNIRDPPILGKRQIRLSLTSYSNDLTIVPMKRAFTLTELLVVIGVVAIICALLLPTISAAKAKALRTTCISNLRQINQGLRMYSDDSSDKTPRTPGTANAPGLNWTGYKDLMKSYVGQNGASSPPKSLFACPADTFHYDFFSEFGTYVPTALHDHADSSSYAFNGGNARTNSNAPGIAGRTVASIIQPSRTLLVMEAPALIPYSWHDPKRPFTKENAIFNDAKNVVSFVDGHVNYIKIHWGGNNPPGSLALHSDPPAEYEYKWSGD
jgi:prepilin-type N-terminal cleavage/methylation domain-containing protein